MHRRLFFCLALLALMIAACQGPPPTQIIMVVTATPETAEETAVVQVDEATPVVSPTNEQSTEVPATSTPETTPTLDTAPTPTITQIQVAEQVFENGRMFWLQPTGQIWVMIVTSEGRGNWQIYEDTFAEGEPEFDPELVAPEGMEQPMRGFGKLWRESPGLREALGWAITPEFGFVTRYEYHPGGTTDAPEPGYHVLLSLYEEAFRFNERNQTWRLN
jgi:hypothetical protein